MTRILAPQCGHPLSTPFKEKLRFGMTLDEARAARPDVAGAIPVPGSSAFPTAMSPLMKEVWRASCFPTSTPRWSRSACA